MASRSAVIRAVRFTLWTAFLLAVLPASPAYALPNLTPFQPSGWSDKIVVSKTTGTNSDSTPLTPTDTLYVDSARINNGNAPTTVRFYTELYVDGALRFTFYKDPPLNPDFYSYFEDYSIGSLPAGMHTIRIKVDSTNAIAETDETDNEYTKTIVVTGAQTCGPGPNDLCLNNGRFKVHINWRVPSQGTSGVGTPVPLTGDTGYFWFFGSNNVELVIKVLDGRPVNGRFWVFYGALSNVEYTITVTDTLTGAVKTYLNPSGTLASFADTDAFAGGSGFSSPVSDTGDVVGDHADRASDPSLASAAQVSGRPFANLARTALAPCTANGRTLCLNNGRFEVQVDWEVPSQGQRGVGTAVPLSGGDTGYFWFFNAGNVELTIKVLNGTALNGKFWVFFGALSNVQYTIHVRDTATGEEKDYTNPDGRLASRADTDAFSVGPIAFNVPLMLDPPAIVGVPYLHSFCEPPPLLEVCGGGFAGTTNPMGGARPYHFQLNTLGGFPPIGLILGPNGYLTGTPSVKGSRTFAVCAVDVSASNSCPSTTLNVVDVSISPTSQSFGSSGGTGSVTVTTAPGKPWTASSNASWITITSGAGDSGIGTVSYSVATNSSTSSRVGTMTIAGQTFTVTQSGATAPPPTSSYLFANWTCNNSSQCMAVRGHPNGSAGPFCSLTACTAWNAAYGVGTCTSQALYPIYNYPPAGTCWK